MIFQKTARLTKAFSKFCASILAILSLTNLRAEQVIFTEINYNPASGQPEFIEVTNNTMTPFDIGTWYFSDGVEFTFPDFNSGDAHILKHRERIIVTNVTEAAFRTAYPSTPAEVRVFGPYTGSLSNSGEKLELSNKNGVAMAYLEYNDGGKWPASADGAGHTLTRINPNRARGEWRNWTSSAAPGGTPGRPPASDDDLPTITTQIAVPTSVWKYDQNMDNVDRGTIWRESDFDDGDWPEGPGLFGRNSGDPFGTPWTTGGRFTYYLRQEFEFNDAFSSAAINISSHIDDGLVIYLNGLEITRFNMPAGEINYDTPAVEGREWDDLAEIASGTDISAALKLGRNVLAVEVHNQSIGSSDIAFGANISITATEPPSGALPNLIFSEVHFGMDGNIDWIELHAPGNSPVSTSGLKISPTRSFTDTVDLSGNIPAGGYLSFPVAFPADENGDVDLFLIQGSTVIDAIKLDRDLEEESFQLFPIGGEFYGGPGHTRDAPNDPISRVDAIVINEIMYDPPSDQTAGEFIELYNRSGDAINLSGWKFTKGVNFDFPNGTVINGNSYLVIARDSNCLLSAHGGINVIGNWSGSLRGSGELIRLVDNNGNMADEVDYMPDGDWPNLASGEGSSMELRHPDMNNNISTAWTDSDEREKTSMETFSYTADFIRSPWLPLTSGQELHSHLVGDSHVIIENVSVKLNNSGSNLVQNPGVMSPDNSSAKGWVSQGTHWASFMDGGKLNLIADGHGDNKANRAEVDMNAPVVGNSYTLTFDGRWVSGKSRVIFQTLDHGFGTTFLLPIPEDLGTPGAPNSSMLPSAAPTVSEVIHSPAVPKSGSPVTVSARIDSAAALSSVEVVYRLDNDDGDGTWQRRTMTDDGTGLYSASVNQYTSNTNIIQFYVEAKSGTQSTLQPIKGPDSPAMWIVDNREMPSVLHQERFIISEYDRRALTTSVGGGPAFGYNFPRMSNHFFNATFIAGESEIYYNAEIRKSGSPFTRSDNSAIDHGKWKLPGDRLFRNRRRSVIDASGTPQGSGTPRFYDDRIARYFLYQLGHPVNEMEFVHSVINDDAHKLRENHEPISNDFLNRNFEDGTKGTLLRIDDEWRFTSDNGDSRQSRNADWSYKDNNNPISYQSEWIMRSRESDHDFDNFIEFTRNLDENNLDVADLDRQADAKMLGLNAAVRGYDADWDTITVNRGKNAYLYRPKEGDGWMLIHWDGDRVFERTTQAILGNRTGVGKYFAQDHVRRYVNYYLTKLLDEHTRGSARTEAWMDAEIASVSGSGVVMPKSHYMNWFNVRENFSRNFVTNGVNNTPFAITTSNAPTTEDLLSLAGTAPPTVFNIHVPGHESAAINWIDKTDWTIDGLVLEEGSNMIVVNGMDHDGNIIESETFTINKTTNAPPIIVVDTTPKSLNVGLDETLTMDASASFDPEGDLLSYTWSVTPEYGATLVPSETMASATFSIPGVYVFSVSASDSSPQTSTRTIAVAVYGSETFSTFGNGFLEDFWTYSDVEKRGNASAGPYYTLEDNSGRLTVNIPLSTTPLGLLPPSLPAPVMYFDFGNVWKYNDRGDELTINGVFAQPDYDDSGEDWLSGPGFLGRGESGLPDPGLQTDTLQRGSAANGLITYYFRTEFEFTGDPIGAQLYIDHIVDDGVRYYLNGQVLGNVRLPAGDIDSNTPGDKLPNEDEIEEDVLVVDVSGSLIQGTNVFAAEVHNESTGSSDVVFGARVDIAANEDVGNVIDLEDTIHPWVRRPLPEGNWTMQTEVKLEKAQFGEFYAGLLVEADQGGNAFRYGIGFKDGTNVATMKVNPSGTSDTMVVGPAVDSNLIIVRLERSSDTLIFSWHDGTTFTPIQTLALPPGTTFSVGGVFASTEINQTIEASFDYAMLVESSTDFTAWMVANGFTDANAPYGDTGMNNLMAYALGRDLSNLVTPIVSADGGTVSFSHRQRLPVSNVDYSVESSSDLENWSPAGDLAQDGNLVENPDGTWTANLLSNLTPEEQPFIFYRLLVKLPQ